MFIKFIFSQGQDSDHIQEHMTILRAMGAKTHTMENGSIAFGFDEKTEPVRKFPREWFEGDWNVIVSAERKTNRRTTADSIMTAIDRPVE